MITPQVMILTFPPAINFVQIYLSFAPKECFIVEAVLLLNSRVHVSFVFTENSLLHKSQPVKWENLKCHTL